MVFIKYLPFFLMVLIVQPFLSCHAASTRYDFRDPGMRNSVYFISDAPLETVIGVTNFVSGWLELDPMNLKGPISGEVEVDTRTFETGMPSRNFKIREIFLGSVKQPLAVFKPYQITEAGAPALKVGTSVQAKVMGVLSAHGMELKILMPVRLELFKENPATKKRITGNFLQVKSDFVLRTPDFKIVLPAAFQGIIRPEVKFNMHALGVEHPPTGTPP